MMLEYYLIMIDIINHRVINFYLINKDVYNCIILFSINHAYNLISHYYYSC